MEATHEFDRAQMKTYMMYQVLLIVVLAFFETVSPFPLLDAAHFPPTLDQRCYIREPSSRPVMLQETSGLQYR